MASCFIESLGCAKNLVDSEVFAQLMVDRGLSYTEKIEEADLVLVNTCAFIQDARNELDQVLSNMMEIVSAEQLLVVTGCIMNNGLEKFKYLFPDVDAWIGLKDFVAFSAFLDEKFPGTQAHLGAGDRYPIDNNPYAYLRISDGCLNNCSYCTIPRIRGSLSSIPIKALVREAERLALRGAKELAIIAQDTCNYGLDLSGERQLPALLAELHKIKQFKWLRLLYLNPDNFDLQWLELFGKYPKLLPYFEIPIQHINTRILSSMGRKKKSDDLYALIESIRTALPNAVFRSTLITGYPGEDTQAFNELVTAVKRLKIENLGAFVYSPEEGTPASELPNQVDPELAGRRMGKILNLQSELRQVRLESYVGKRLTILVESILFTGEVDDNMKEDEISCSGRPWFFAPDVDGVVIFTGGEIAVGDFVVVEIEDVIDLDLYGTYICHATEKDIKDYKI